MFLTHDGLISPIGPLRSRLGPHWEKFLAKLTVTHFPVVGPPKRAHMYETLTIAGVKCIRLPRTVAAKLTTIATVRVQFAPIRRIRARLGIDLYDDQKVVIKHIMQTALTPARIAAGTASCILNMEAGFGKTFIGAGLIMATGLRTLWVTPKKPLRKQAIDDLRLAFSDEDGNCSIVIGGYGLPRKDGPPPAQQDVTVIIINSACAQNAAFFAGYSLIVLDEFPMYCSAKRRKIFQHATHAVFAMSATTEDRLDGFDPIAHKAIAYDPIIRAATLVPPSDDVKFTRVVRVIRYTGPPEYTRNLRHEATQRLFMPYMHKQFVADPARLNIAVDELVALYDWRGPDNIRHGIFIFAEELDILRVIRSAFIAALKARNRADIVDNFAAFDAIGDDSSMFTGGLDDDAITSTIRDCRVLFTTYGYAGTGVSIRKMTAILFMTPRRSNMLQIIRRIQRRGSDLRIPRVVVDILDNATKVRSQFADRRLAYAKSEFKQIDLIADTNGMQADPDIEPDSDDPDEDTVVAPPALETDEYD